ncbi:hypothetical protein Q7P37_002828 [Cladosporium fusiforme]
MAVSQFRDSLQRLGLSQYHDGLVSEAFDSWEVLADITEEDLDALGVKLGHRRSFSSTRLELTSSLQILQRAIAASRKDDTQPTPAADVPIEHRHVPIKSEVAMPPQVSNSGVNGSSRVTTGSKRKYRRHPKPDENAPDRPPSAYVLFSNQVREHLKGRELSFTEIAKTVGERWQVLPPDEKATYESRSQAMKDHFYAQLAEYKKSQDFVDYQKYLAEFKAKHEPNNGKRLKDDKSGSPSRRSSDERLVSSPDNRESSANSSEHLYGDRRPSGFGSPQILNRVDWRPSTRSENISPDTASGMVPLEPGFSPRHNKPAFASINGPPPNNHTTSQSYRAKTQNSNSMGEHPMAISTSLAYGYHPSLTPSSSGSPPIMQSRRPTLASENSLPSLRHSDSLSSSHSAAGSPLSGSAPGSNPSSRSLPSRELPPPFASRPASGLQQLPTLPPMKAPGSPPMIQYSPSSSGLATLLRAGEHLASNGSMDGPYKESRYP